MKTNHLKTFAAAIAMASSSIMGYAQTNDNHCGLIGFANYHDLNAQGTTGGGQGPVVRVTTREQLAQYAQGSNPCVIIIENDIIGNGNIGEGADGRYDYVSIGSNKTIIGAGNGITISKLGFDARNQHNIILRNMRITDCNPDAIAFRTTHHVWVDHCDLSSCADGLLDFTIGSSYLSVSWTKFSNHDKVSICNSGTNHFEDNGKERATYHHCMFTNTTQRNPRFGYGLGHVFNNYYTANSSYCVGYHSRAKVVVENSAFNNTHTPLNQMYSDDPLTANYADVLSRGNLYQNVSGNTKDTGVGFDIELYYGYAPAMTTADKVETLTSQMGLANDLEHDIIPFPGNYAIDVLSNYTLQCGAINQAQSYLYNIGEENGDATKYSTYTPGETKLKPSTTYAWYALVATPDKTYQSSIFHFTTAAEKTSKPTPEDGDMHAHLREALQDKVPCTPTRLQWREAFDATSYKVYLSKGTSVSENDLVGETSNNWITPSPLVYGQTYAWRVDAIKANGEVVKGDTWTFGSDKKEANLGRTEMEDATLNGIAYIEEASPYRSYSGSKAVVGENGPGCMSVIWDGDDIEGDITTTYFDWQKANSTYTLFVNEQLKDSWIATVDGKNMATHTSNNIVLKRGDEIRINFCTDGKQRMRTDCIDIALSKNPTDIKSIDLAPTTKSLRIYTIDGRYVGDHVEGLDKGVYIVNGKKVLL